MANTLIGSSTFTDALTTILFQTFLIDTFAGNGGRFGAAIGQDSRRGRCLITAAYPSAAEWVSDEGIWMAGESLSTVITDGVKILAAADSDDIAATITNPGYVEAQNSPAGIGTITNPGFVEQLVPLFPTARVGQSTMQFELKRYTGALFLCSELGPLTICVLSESW